MSAVAALEYWAGRNGETENLPNEIAREIASNIMVIGIALLGVTFVVLSISWNGFKEVYYSLPLKIKKQLIELTVIANAIIVIPTVTVTVVGVRDPSLVEASGVLTFMALIVIFFVYTIATLIMRWLQNKPLRDDFSKLDTGAFAHTQALLNFVFCIFCSAGAIWSATDSALDISVGQYTQDNFEFARWMLRDSVLFFMVGLLMLSVSLLLRKSPVADK